MAKREVLPQKQIALVAHDNKKDSLIRWAARHKESLQSHQLLGTGTTAEAIEEQTGLKLERLLSGPLGGDQQLGAMIATGKIDLLVFFWDPMQSQPHDDDVKAVLRLATLWNVALASNETTADFLLTSVLISQSVTIHIPDAD